VFVCSSRLRESAALSSRCRARTLASDEPPSTRGRGGASPCRCPLAVRGRVGVVDQIRSDPGGSLRARASGTHRPARRAGLDWAWRRGGTGPSRSITWRASTSVRQCVTRVDDRARWPRCIQQGRKAPVVARGPKMASQASCPADCQGFFARASRRVDQGDFRPRPDRRQSFRAPPPGVGHAPSDSPRARIRVALSPCVSGITRARSRTVEAPFSTRVTPPSVKNTS